MREQQRLFNGMQLEFQETVAAMKRSNAMVFHRLTNIENRTQRIEEAQANTDRNILNMASLLDDTFYPSGKEVHPGLAQHLLHASGGEGSHAGEVAEPPLASPFAYVPRTLPSVAPTDSISTAHARDM